MIFIKLVAASQPYYHKQLLPGLNIQQKLDIFFAWLYLGWHILRPHNWYKVSRKKVHITFCNALVALLAKM